MPNADPVAAAARRRFSWPHKGLALLLLSAVGGCLSVENAFRWSGAPHITRNVPTVADGNPKHRMDLYIPEGVAPGFATVVFVHGGYWIRGDKDYYAPVVGLYGNAGVALADLGIATAVTSYRLFPETDLAGMLDDVAAAVRTAQAQVVEAGGDPHRIVLAGHSAGGHLVALLGMRPELLRTRGIAPSDILGVASLSGVYDIATTATLVTPELRDTVFLPLFGSTAAEQERVSPRAAFGPTMPPTLFLVGELDYPSSRRDFEDAQTHLQDLVGARAFFVRVPGNTHEDMVLEMGTVRDGVTPAIAAFVRHLIGVRSAQR